MIGGMKKLVTHNSGFHTDDVTAYAILQEVLTRRGESWELIRTRDLEIIQTGDIVFDVGEVYDANTHRYDHHQKGRAGERENGILYASAGLIWKHFGRELCSSDEIWKKIDLEMIAGIDANDNGQDLIKESFFPKVKMLSISSIISLYTLNSIKKDATPEMTLQFFEETAQFVRRILVNFISQEEYLQEKVNEVIEFYKRNNGQEYIVLEYDYGRALLKKMYVLDKLLLVIYLSKDGTRWRIEAIKKNTDNLEYRILAPLEWRGASEQDLQKITGVSDVLFCHASGFLCAAKTREGAEKIAQQIINQQHNLV